MDRNAERMKVGGIDVVALRKESVDRNCPPGPPSFLFGASLSARRAWIEILLRHCRDSIFKRRSPQGERG